MLQRSTGRTNFDQFMVAVGDVEEEDEEEEKVENSDLEKKHDGGTEDLEAQLQRSGKGNDGEEEKSAFDDIDISAAFLCDSPYLLKKMIDSLFIVNCVYLAVVICHTSHLTLVLIGGVSGAFLFIFIILAPLIMIIVVNPPLFKVLLFFCISLIFVELPN